MNDDIPIRRIALYVTLYVTAVTLVRLSIDSRSEAAYYKGVARGLGFVDAWKDVK